MISNSYSIFSILNSIVHDTKLGLDLKNIIYFKYICNELFLILFLNKFKLFKISYKFKVFIFKYRALKNKSKKKEDLKTRKNILMKFIIFHHFNFLLLS